MLSGFRDMQFIQNNFPCIQFRIEAKEVEEVIHFLSQNMITNKICKIPTICNKMITKIELDNHDFSIDRSADVESLMWRPAKNEHSNKEVDRSTASRPRSDGYDRFPARQSEHDDFPIDSPTVTIDFPRGNRSTTIFRSIDPPTSNFWCDVRPKKMNT